MFRIVCLFFTFHRSKWGYNNHMYIEIHTPHNVLSHHTRDKWVPSLLQDGKDLKKKKFKDCNWKHQKNGDIWLEPKIPKTFEVCFEFNILSLQPQWLPRDCLQNPRPQATQMLSLNSSYNVDVCVIILSLYVFILITKYPRLGVFP
jgi:hypothetical protein